jgi:hypothetical protein
VEQCDISSAFLRVWDRCFGDKLRCERWNRYEAAAGFSWPLISDTGTTKESVFFDLGGGEQAGGVKGGCITQTLFGSIASTLLHPPLSKVQY